MRFERVLTYIREIAVQTRTIKKIILFGSRARGDYSERSDFDFAIFAPDIDDGD